MNKPEVLSPWPTEIVKKKEKKRSIPTKERKSPPPLQGIRCKTSQVSWCNIVFVQAPEEAAGEAAPQW